MNNKTKQKKTKEEQLVGVKCQHFPTSIHERKTRPEAKENPGITSRAGGEPRKII